MEEDTHPRAADSQVRPLDDAAVVRACGLGVRKDRQEEMCGVNVKPDLLERRSTTLPFGDDSPFGHRILFQYRLTFHSDWDTTPPAIATGAAEGTLSRDLSRNRSRVAPLADHLPHATPIPEGGTMAGQPPMAPLGFR